MSATVAVEKDMGIPPLEQDTERASEVLPRWGEGGVTRSLHQSLENSLRVFLDAAKRLQNKRPKGSLVFCSKTVIFGMLEVISASRSSLRPETEIGVSSRMDHSDIEEGEVVGKVQLKVRMGAGDGEIGRLEEAGDAELIGGRAEERSDGVMTGGDRERLEELAGEEMRRIVGEKVAAGAGARKVVMRGQAKAQAGGEGESVVVEGVAELRREGLKPEGGTVGTKSVKASLTAIVQGVI